MNLLFTICGRAGSKGIKNKNIRNFLEKPLPLYVLSLIDLYLKKHSDIHYDIVLNTDSKELIRIVMEYRKRKIEIIERDAALADDNVAKCDVIRNCYMIMKMRKQCDYDMVVDLDIASPVRRLEDLEALICKMQETRCDIVETVTESRKSPYFNIVKETEHGVKTVIEAHYTTRQEAPVTYDENAAMYAYGTRFLTDSMDWDDSYREIILMPDTGILDLDKPVDLELMQVIANYLLTTDSGFRNVYENIS